AEKGFNVPELISPLRYTKLASLRSAPRFRLTNHRGFATWEIETNELRPDGKPHRVFLCLQRAAQSQETAVFPVIRLFFNLCGQLADTARTFGSAVRPPGVSWKRAMTQYVSCGATPEQAVACGASRCVGPSVPSC